ncbi:MAG: hypothetical protein HYY28_00035 [Betaproteobacteria bacterium]|nr:hypothetical protein [Betaproteobacteria bacterium]
MPRLFKRLRARFGISAPRMAVRTHIAWYWRWIGMILVASACLAIAASIYDAGRRYAGFDRGEFAQEVEKLKQTMRALEEELARLRSIANAGESRLKIEQAAQSQLAQQVKTVEAENARLREDLAFFENLLPAGDRLSIHRLKVERDILPGEYRYRLLILQGGKRDRPFQGSLQFLVSVRQGDRDDMIVFPGEHDPVAPRFALSFKHFYRGEGVLRIPPTARVKTVQVRVLESGSNQARATQSVNLS